PLPYRGIGKSHFKPGAGARDHLYQVRTADNADEIAVLAHDRNSLDPMLFELRRDFMQWRFRGGSYDVGGHNVFNLGRVRFDVVGRDRGAAGQEMHAPRVGAFSPGFRAMHQIAFTDNANKLASTVNDRNRTDVLLEQHPCDVSDTRTFPHGDDGRNHYIACLHDRRSLWRSINGSRRV